MNTVQTRTPARPVWSSCCSRSYRISRPRFFLDKAKVEGSELIVERRMLAALRHYQHFSLGQVNAAIRELLEALNNRIASHQRSH